MSAQYPSNIYAPRTMVNRVGVEYDETKTKVIYAEDLNKDRAEIVAIENELGTNPKGAFSSVKDRLDSFVAPPVKATGAEINTGTDDAKFATPKAIADSDIAFLSDIPAVPVKATGAEINTGTDDAKFATPKAIEDSNLVKTAKTQTLTNKRVTKRVVTTTDDSTAVIDVDVTDVYELSAVANATTFSISGTPDDGQPLIIRFKDAGVAKGLTWDAIFVAIGVTLPSTTVAGKWHYIGCQYNSAAGKFHVLATGVQS